MSATIVVDATNQAQQTQRESDAIGRARARRKKRIRRRRRRRRRIDQRVEVRTRSATISSTGAAFRAPPRESSTSGRATRGRAKRPIRSPVGSSRRDARSFVDRWGSGSRARDRDGRDHDAHRTLCVCVCVLDHRNSITDLRTNQPRTTAIQIAIARAGRQSLVFVEHRKSSSLC